MRALYTVVVLFADHVISFELRADRACDARLVATVEFPGAVQVTAFEVAS